MARRGPGRQPASVAPPPGAMPFSADRLRPAGAAARSALGGLLLRDLAVLRKHAFEFVLRTLIQPFLLVFVFLYVFPEIGQSVGGGRGSAARAARLAARADRTGLVEISVVVILPAAPCRSG